MKTVTSAQQAEQSNMDTRVSQTEVSVLRVPLEPLEIHHARREVGVHRDILEPLQSHQRCFEPLIEVLHDANLSTILDLWQLCSCYKVLEGGCDWS